MDTRHAAATCRYPLPAPYELRVIDRWVLVVDTEADQPLPPGYRLNLRALPSAIVVAIEHVSITRQLHGHRLAMQMARGRAPRTHERVELFQPHRNVGGRLGPIHGQWERLELALRAVL